MDLRARYHVYVLEAWRFQGLQRTREDFSSFGGLDV